MVTTPPAKPLKFLIHTLSPNLLLISGLLADEDRARLHRTFAEHRLRRAIGKGTETTSFRLAQKRFIGINRLARRAGLSEARGDSHCSRLDLGRLRRNHLRLAKLSARRHGRDLTRF